MSGNLQLLAGTLARAKRENRAALIAGMTAGFPTVDEGIAAIQAILNNGADIVEVGLPHSDPVLDGPVIQAAGDIALRGGVRIADVIRTVREANQATGKPVLVMSYWNPIDKYGAERFSGELSEAGGAGCILPDLPVQGVATPDDLPHWESTRSSIPPGPWRNPVARPAGRLASSGGCTRLSDHSRHTAVRRRISG